MLTNIDLGWTVLFNDHSGVQFPALVTKIYTPEDPNSDLDLHVIGIKSNSSFARGKIQVSYGESIIGCWQYSTTREIRIATSDLPLDREGLIYNAINDIFETELINSQPGTSLDCIDGGLF